MTIVGVTREGFTGVQVGQTPQMFIAMTMKAQMTPNWDGLNEHKDYWLAIMGRLKPGLTADQAEKAFAPVYDRYWKRYFRWRENSRPKGSSAFLQSQCCWMPDQEAAPSYSAIPKSRCSY